MVRSLRRLHDLLGEDVTFLLTEVMVRIGVRRIVIRHLVRHHVLLCRVNGTRTP